MIADDRPIALTGFMGAGKTRVGRRLAELLDRPFYDTDEWVEARSGRAVTSFFPAEEATFRRFEAEAVAALLERGASVIALGGGALLDPGSRGRLRERALLVHLHVPWSRLRREIPALVASRPLLEGRSLRQVHDLYRARLELYGEAAITVTVPPEHAAEAVLRALRRNPAAGGGPRARSAGGARSGSRG